MKKTSIYLILFFYCLTVYNQNPGENLFNDQFLHEIKLSNADTNFFITTKDYQLARLTVDGETIDSIGFKRKGNISFYASTNKYPIKIKTNKYVSGKKIDGIKEFTLHMNFQDPSMLREKLTYDLCRELNLYSLRTAFAKLYINDIYWGLYTIVEGKDEMYKLIFNNRDMDAIESLDFGDMCYISDNPDDYNFELNGWWPTYQLENGNSITAWPRFAKMIDKANNTSEQIYIDTVSKYMNLEHFFKLQAINVILMNFDSYIGFRGNQIFAYDTICKQWQIIPWDFNASFGLWNTNNYSPSEYSILPDDITTGCIASGVINITTLYNYYLYSICELKHILEDTTSYFNRIEFFKNQIRDAVYEDSRKVVSNENFENASEYGFQQLFGESQPSLKKFILERLEIINQEFDDLNFECPQVSVNNKYNEQNILKFYPNPANDIIYIEQEEFTNSNYRLRIYNSTGKLEIDMYYVPKAINLCKLQHGLYFIEIYSGEIRYVTKFIKE